MIEGLCEYLWTFIPEIVAPRFVSEVPSQSDEGVSLSLNNGEDNIRYFATNETLYKPYIECNIRVKEYEKGEEFAKLIRQALHGFVDEPNGILGIVLLGSESYLGKNEDKLHEFQLMFRSMILEKE